jgi:hypothetical protein
MASIQCFRFAGDIYNPNPIVEPLLSELALVERGRYELDAHATNKSQLSVEIVYQDDLRLGEYVNLYDPTSSSYFMAKITGISLRFSKASIQQVLTLERSL